jgi:hypothetical protein
MKPFVLLLILALSAAALLTAVQPPLAIAQLDATPILGEPVLVTPIATTPGGRAPTAERIDAPFPSEDALPSLTPEAATMPDACEPNDTPGRACPLPLDAVSGPFTMVPESDQDFFQLDLPQEASIQTVVTVRATSGLDLVVSARQGEQLVASGTFSLTLASELAGPITLRVENRDPYPSIGEQYRVEVRREIAPPNAENAMTDGPQPDALENNWSFETASPIAVGVVYDLTFACPETRPGACPGGDHDYLLVPVKAGVPYLLATFDLDPGVDTVVELFWDTTTTASTGNDDYAPGGSLSALEWTAPADGLLRIRIAPRNGGLAPQLADAKASYRFAIAPLASELARKLDATIRQQANVPSPTPTAAASSPASVPPSGSGANGGSDVSAGGTAAQESIAGGPAIIVAETVLRREPSERGTALATLALETQVTVRGPVSGLWVSVETSASILPGWVRWSDLRRADGAETTTDAGETSDTATPASQQSGAADASPSLGATSTSEASPFASSTSAAGAGQPPARQVVVTALDPALPPPQATPVARIPFTLSVVVAARDRPTSDASSFSLASPTPDLRQPISGVRVQLVNVFGDLLAESLTDTQGAASLRRDVRAGDALAVRIPAWGIELPLAADQTRLILTIPEATR